MGKIVLSDLRPARQLWVANRPLPFVFLLSILINTLEIIAPVASLGRCLLRVVLPMILVRVNRGCLSSSSLILLVLVQVLHNVVGRVFTVTYGMGS